MEELSAERSRLSDASMNLSIIKRPIQSLIYNRENQSRNNRVITVKLTKEIMPDLSKSRGCSSSPESGSKNSQSPKK
jgi:hypothetical protein